jgi:predicted protein tyrosine phosphatase
MDTLSSYARQFKNYARFFGTRVVAVGSKYMKHGTLVLPSTPRVPHTTPDKAPTAYQNAKDTLTALFISPTCILDTPTVCVYVGSAFNTASEYTFTREHVTHVLACIGKRDTLPVFYAECIESYYKVAMRDEPDETIDFAEDPRVKTGVHEFLQGVFAPSRDASHKATLLVHCVFGRSRSVAMCMLVLFLYYHHMGNPKTMVECYQYIGQKRKVVGLMCKFLLGLTQFEERFKTDATFREHWMKVFV